MLLKCYDNKMVKSPYNCFIYPLNQPQVANQQKKEKKKKCDLFIKSHPLKTLSHSNQKQVEIHNTGVSRTLKGWETPLGKSNQNTGRKEIKQVLPFATSIPHINFYSE